ncbi:hypothetical protein POM88_013373 [Heracleum sosnowskyi]|uniref:Uncharacterized protein n=1 Tax=Heracleum sosnowskyi TaxID=360622 RepID=A0AAD8J1Q4_9APIA|nr:hypothetical protein POM88_013373 [Heracleum sosnowskyi]
MLVGVSQHLEVIRRGFLWGEFSENGQRIRNLHLLKWDKLTLSKNSGGLGITPMHVKNKALLGKWWYKWIADKHANWNKLIRAKYDCRAMDDLGAAIRNKNAYASLLGISSINNIEGFSGALDVNEFMWDIKDGSTALFCEDKWLESGA